MCVECSFCSLRDILLRLFSEAYTGAGPWGALKVQCSNSNTKVGRGQVHSLYAGPTRDHGVHLTCRPFHSSKIPKR